MSKNIGHPTSGSGGKKSLSGTSKVNTQTDKHIDGQTDRRTFRLIESIGPEGRCFKIASEGPQKNIAKKYKKNMKLSGFFSDLRDLNYQSYKLFKATFQ